MAMCKWFELKIEMKMLSKVESRWTPFVLMEIAEEFNCMNEQNPRHDSDILFMRWTLSEGMVRLMHLIENVSDETMNCCFSRSLFFYVWDNHVMNFGGTRWCSCLEKSGGSSFSSPIRIWSFSQFQRSTKLGFDWLVEKPPMVFFFFFFF